MPSFVRPVSRGAAVVLFASCLAAAVGPQAHAATLTVDDDGDGAPQAGVCTLRSVVAAANTDAAVGGCAAGSGADEVLFPPDITEVVLTAGQLVVTEDVALRGARRVTLRRDLAAPLARIIDVTGEDTVLTLDRITVRDGHTVADTGEGRGAGIRSAGDVSLIDSVVTANRTEGDSAGGGGIRAEGAVTLLRSEVSDNRTDGRSAAGAGIHAADVTMTASLLRGNIASGNNVTGGGIFARNVDAIDSIIADNAVTGPSGVDGGGMYTVETLRVERSLVTGNSANPAVVDSVGGGLACVCLMEVLDSTVSGNSAAIGGGIGTPYLTAYSSTFTDNTSTDGTSGGIALLQIDGVSQFRLSSSIVHGNTGDIGAPLGGVLVVGSHNIVESAAPPAVYMPEDTRDCDPMLDALADNGGATWTHALDAGSCALDSGDNPGGFTVDQRGAPRTSGAATDVGAFEALPDLVFSDGFE